MICEMREAIGLERNALPAFSVQQSIVGGQRGCVSSALEGAPVFAKLRTQLTMSWPVQGLSATVVTAASPLTALVDVVTALYRQVFSDGRVPPSISVLNPTSYKCCHFLMYRWFNAPPQIRQHYIHFSENSLTQTCGIRIVPLSVSRGSQVAIARSQMFYDFLGKRVMFGCSFAATVMASTECLFHGLSHWLSLPNVQIISSSTSVCRRVAPSAGVGSGTDLVYLVNYCSAKQWDPSKARTGVRTGVCGRYTCEDHVVEGKYHCALSVAAIGGIKPACAEGDEFKGLVISASTGVRC